MFCHVCHGSAETKVSCFDPPGCRRHREEWTPSIWGRCFGGLMDMLVGSPDAVLSRFVTHVQDAEEFEDV